MTQSTLYETLQVAAVRRPDHPAIVMSGRDVSYAELLTQTDQIAASLVAIGVEPGDRLALMMSNGPEFVASFVAISSIGAAMVALNMQLSRREITEILADARIAHVLAGGEAVKKSMLQDLRGAHESCDGQRMAVLGESSWDALIEQGVHTERSKLDQRRSGVQADDVALIVYTSGSTGCPKGVVLTHRNILRNVEQQNVHFRMTADVRQLWALPGSHVGGATITVCSALIGAFTLVAMPTFDPEETLQLIVNGEIDFFGGVPTMFHMIISHPSFGVHGPVRLQKTGVAGAACPAALMRKIVAMSDETYTGYGMTETAGFITYTRPDAPLEEMIDTVGVADERVELRIVDREHRTLPAGAEGEVAVRSEMVTPGYLFQQEASDEAIDSEGWYYSGDVGRLDERGNLTLVGRSKQMYICGGNNVYPAEVEALLVSHVQVAMVACIAVSDAKMGEIGWAFVVPVDVSAVDEAELEQHCRAGLAGYKVPAKFIFRDSLPLTSLGKIDRRALVVEIQQLRNQGATENGNSLG
ncbi:MAG: class I adenylate-forming enzyme family protein [Pirellulales bacterium]